jgi:peptide/nickel transport system substrate-binding protein
MHRIPARHRWLGFCWIAVLAVFTVAAAPAGKKDLVVLQAADVQKFDPHMSTSEPDTKITFNIFDNLAMRDDDLQVKPALATEWKRLSNTVWEFKLRPGVKFHNGEPLTAETVRFSLARTIPSGDPAVITRTTFTTFERIEVADPSTVRIVTKVPDPFVPDRLAMYGGQIIPKQYFEKVGAAEFNAKPVGTGPLKFVEWIKDDHASFEAVKDWWGGKLDFEKVLFRPVPEPAARIAALLKGEADIITKLPPDDVERVNKSANAKVAGVFYSGFYVLNSNYERPFPMNSKLVHQALSLAIDREAIVKELWRGQGVVPNGVYPKGNMAYDANLPPLPYDPAKAKDLLRQAGYKNEEIVIETTDGYVANDKQMGEAIVTMWKDVGVNAKLEVIEYSVRAQKYRARSFKGFFWTDPTDIFNDPAGQVWRLAGPGAPSAYLRIPEWEAIMQQAVVTFDPVKRRHMYLEAQKFFMDHLMWIPVIQPIESYGVQKFIDWKPRGNQILRVDRVRLVR